jgi:hypothetical protein
MVGSDIVNILCNKDKTLYCGRYLSVVDAICRL